MRHDDSLKTVVPCLDGLDVGLGLLLEVLERVLDLPVKVHQE